MNILITGAKGFIGKNLIAQLNNIKEGKVKEERIPSDLTVFAYDIDTDPGLLDKYCREADFVFHLAGVNRPKEQSEFMEDIIHPDHHVVHRTLVAHVADIEFDFRILVLMPHIVLLLFVAAEDANLFDIRIEKPPQHGIAERPRAAGNKENFVGKCSHVYLLIR
jgi:hypothetical protein